MMVKHLWPETRPEVLPYVPEIDSPLSAQDFKFAWANCERQEEMVLPVVGNDDALLDFDDGRWWPRLLPIYDGSQSLLHPKHYGELKGALVSMTVIAVSKVEGAANKSGCYWQVKGMDVLRVARNM